MQVLHRAEERDPTAVLKVLAIGPHLFSVAADGALCCFDLDNRQLHSQLRLEPNPRWRTDNVILSGSMQTDRVLATTGSGPALLIRASDVSTVATLGGKHPIMFGGVSNDGRCAFTLDGDNELTVWETERGLKLASFALNARPRGAWWLGSREILVWDAGREMLRYRLEASGDASRY